MKYWWLIGLFLFLGFLLRLLFVSTSILQSGDLLAQAEWGRKFWELGAKDFYFSRHYLFTMPTYPPLSNLIYALAFFLNDHRLILAQIHNSLGIIPPALMFFLDKVDPNTPYLFNYGYFLLLKLPTILADLGISILIYRWVWEITGSMRKALAGLVIYLVNPVGIFLSAIWGQTESLVALPALLAFYTAQRRKFFWAIPLFFVSLYLKPTWVLVLPFFILVIVTLKPKFKGILGGVGVALFIYLVSTWVFSGSGIFDFTLKMILKNVSPLAKGYPKFSVSALNFHAFWSGIGKDILPRPLTLISLFPYSLLNYFAFDLWLKDKKRSWLTILAGIFIIGLGSYLFMFDMLERYFFPAFIPLIILLVWSWKKFWPLILANAILFVNLYWSFYRRSGFVINEPVLRILSLAMVLVFLVGLIKLTNERGRTFRSDG